MCFSPLFAGLNEPAYAADDTGYGYLIISAGPDGIYGSADDVFTTNIKQVEKLRNPAQIARFALNVAKFKIGKHYYYATSPAKPSAFEYSRQIGEGVNNIIESGNLKMAVNYAQIPANEAVIITVEVKDENGNPIANAPVHFETTLGVLNPQDTVTDGDGIAQTILTSSQPGTATVTATVNGETITYQVTFGGSGNGSGQTQQPQPSGAVLSGDRAVAVIGQKVYLAVEVKDSDGNPIANYPVQFQTNFGTLNTNESLTNSSGIAYAELTANQTGTATVTATAGSKTATYTVTFVNEPQGITVVDTPQTAFVGGEVTIKVAITDNSGQPIENIPVQFSTNLGTIQPQTANTDVNGIATARLTSNQSGKATITIIALDKTITYEINLIEQQPNKTIVLNSSKLTANVGEKITITATVKDINNQPISNAQVSFSTSLGTITPQNAVTNQEGVAYAELTSNQEGMATVAATIDDKTETIQIIFVTPQSGGGSGTGPLRQPDYDEIPIYTAEELSKIGNDPSYPRNAKYIQMADISLSGYSNWNPLCSTTSNSFTGRYDGNGFVISDLTINRPNADFQGLFGYNYGTLKNIVIKNANITANSQSGGLVASNGGIIDNSRVEGYIYATYTVGGITGSNATTNSQIINSIAITNVTGKSNIGGLIGLNSGTIRNSYHDGTVTGYSSSATDLLENIGGLAGYNSGSIENCYSTGDVIVPAAFSNTSDVGGLVGENNKNATIINSCTTANVSTSADRVGGLVGNNYGAVVQSYALSNVYGDSAVGGLVGYNMYMSNATQPGTIENSYAAGYVEGKQNVGGLLGSNDCATVKNTYSISTVVGNTNAGGLIGYVSGYYNPNLVGSLKYAYVYNSYCIDTSGTNKAIGYTGNYATISNVGVKTASQLKQRSTFANWDFANIWAIDENISYPYLKNNEQTPHPGSN